mgnify:FL=1|jgi:hypothetical protein
MSALARAPGTGRENDTRIHCSGSATEVEVPAAAICFQIFSTLHQALAPPSICRTVPVAKPFVIRNRPACASSDAVPTRPTGSPSPMPCSTLARAAKIRRQIANILAHQIRDGWRDVMNRQDETKCWETYQIQRVVAVGDPIRNGRVWPNSELGGRSPGVNLPPASRASAPALEANLNFRESGRSQVRLLRVNCSDPQRPC